MIFNETEVDLEVKRKGTSGVFALKSQMSGPLMYTIPGDDMHQLNFRIIGLMNEWTSELQINQVGRIYLKLGTMGSVSERLLKVEVTIKEATIFIILQMEEGPWPYKFVNETDTDITIFQKDHRRKFLVTRKKSRQYAWDNPRLLEKSLILQINDAEREIDLLEIGMLSPLKYKSDTTGKYELLDIYTCSEGPTIVITLKTRQERMKSDKRSVQSKQSEDQIIADVI